MINFLGQDRATCTETAITRQAQLIAPMLGWCWPSGYCESMHAVIQKHLAMPLIYKLTFLLRR